MQQNNISVKVKVVGKLLELKEHNPQEFQNMLPTYASIHSSGLDLRVASDETIIIKPNEVHTVGTGLAIYLENPNLTAMVFPRSGRGSKGLVLGNLTGIIDPDYQGELKLTLWNRTQEEQIIQPWERVAQYVIVPTYQAQLNFVDDFDTQTQRGTGGFGSTGHN